MTKGLKCYENMDSEIAYVLSRGRGPNKDSHTPTRTPVDCSVSRSTHVFVLDGAFKRPMILFTTKDLPVYTSSSYCVPIYYAFQILTQVQNESRERVVEVHDYCISDRGGDGLSHLAWIRSPPDVSFHRDQSFRCRGGSAGWTEEEHFPRSRKISSDLVT